MKKLVFTFLVAAAVCAARAQDIPSAGQALPSTAQELSKAHGAQSDDGVKMSTGSTIQLIGGEQQQQHGSLGAPMGELGSKSSPAAASPVTHPVQPQAQQSVQGSDLPSTVEAFGAKVSAVAALAASGKTPPDGLMNAIYDFRQAVREAFGSELKDRGQLGFSDNSAMLAKDYAVLKEHESQVADEHKQALFSSMVALQNALGTAAQSPERKKALLRLKTAQAVFAKTAAGLKKAAPEDVPALLEIQAKAALMELRSALEIYRQDNGSCPAAPQALVPDYLPAVPAATAAGGKKRDAVKIITTDVFADPLDAVTGTGGWLYFADKNSSLFCTLLINSRKKSSSGKSWDRY
jgi:hypothetical protein